MDVNSTCVVFEMMFHNGMNYIKKVIFSSERKLNCTAKLYIYWPN